MNASRCRDESAGQLGRPVRDLIAFILLGVTIPLLAILEQWSAMR